MAEQQEPRVGDWVLVWGQVTSSKGPVSHRYDVRLDSHGEYTVVGIRREHIVVTNEVPVFADRCRAMFTSVETIVTGGTKERHIPVATRCILHYDHHGNHRDAKGMERTDTEVDGYWEAK